MGQIKKLQYGFAGMNQDISKSKRDPRFYYEANNIRITATENDSLGSASIDKGNTIEVSLPTDQIIIHVNSINEYIIVFSSNFSTKGEGDAQVDIIWTYNTNTSTLKTILQADLNFTEAIIESEICAENENIIKIYWVDGVNQYRFINILNPVSSQYPELLDIVPPYIIDQPKLESIDRGGLHTAGKIQYAYNLLIKNGQQTTVSPLSQLIPLAYDNKGGDVNEVVGQINNIIINNVDTRYDIIRIYAIKYTSYNQLPIVSLIVEDNITSNIYRYSDDGSIIYNTSLEALTFLGGTPMIPSTLEVKKNLMLLGNIKEMYFDINVDLDVTDENYFDTRAFRFPKGKSSTKIKESNQEYTDVTYDPIIGFNIDGSKIPKTHDCINDIINNTTTGTLVKSESPIGTYTIERDVITTGINESVYYKFEGIPETLPKEGSPYYIHFSIVAENFPYGEEPEYGRLKPYEFDEIVEINSDQAGNLKYTIMNKLNAFTQEGWILAIRVNDENEVRFNLIKKPIKYGDSYEEYPIKLESFITIYGSTLTDEVTEVNEEDQYMYCRNSTIAGATGDNVEILLQANANIGDEALLKGGETYRIALEFYNDKGQFSQPHWVTDIKVPKGNLNNDFIGMTVKLKNTGSLINQGVVGYRVLRVERTPGNKTRLDQGILSSSVYQLYDDDSLDALRYKGDPSALAEGDRVAGYDNVTDTIYYAPGISTVEKLPRQRNTVPKAVRDFAPKLPSPFMRNKSALISYKITDCGIRLKGDNPRADRNADGNKNITRAVRINKLDNEHLLNDNSQRFLKYIKGDIDSDVDQAWFTWTAYSEIEKFNCDASRIQPVGEVFSSLENGSLDNVNNPHNTGAANSSLTVQNNKLIQLFTPEGVILNEESRGADRFSPVAYLGQTIDDVAAWGRKYSIDTRLVLEDLVKTGTISLFDADTRHGKDLEVDSVWENFWKGIGDWIKGIFNGDDDKETKKDPLRTFFHENGLIGPTGDKKTYIEYQYKRPYTFQEYAPEQEYYFLNQSPLFVGKGEKNKQYSPGYKFHNHLGSFLADRNDRDTSRLGDFLDEDEYCEPLLGIQSIGNNCYTFVEKNETPLDDMVASGEALLAELYRYIPNQYGGNTYEVRSTNSYLRIGDYQSLNISDPAFEYSYRVPNAGDIYVNTFRFQRIVPNISKVYSPVFTSICEILEVPVETSINLKYRSDLSVNGWDADFHVQYEDYHKYNKVYSQEAIATKNTAIPFTFDPIRIFTNKIVSTKIKTSGELVDSWTDVLVNEELLLNSKYGELTKLISHNTNVLAFQETGIAQLQVQPRIQQVTSDGMGVELGTGQILYNYEYITTTSGSCNKLAIYESPSSIYYLDLNNKTFNRFSSNGLEGLSDLYGLHTFFNNNLDYSLKNSKSLLGGYDRLNNDAYIVSKGNFALTFNEQSNSFTSFHNLDAMTHFLRASAGLFTCNGTNTLWKHFNGNKATYYGNTYDSYITFFCSPKNMNGEVIFNNLTLNTEYLDSEDNDVFYNDEDYTIPFKSIFVWNDYMKTNEEDLVYPTNIARKFRTWNLFIPRDKTNIFNRMRGKYAFIKLKIDNSLNNTLVLHDVVLSYIDNNK